ncbi:PQQ-binding-like beta-propeller repeat protein [Stigmatella erecta]|uniref:Outer membrane protein assembly factor BamB, contains PQQ-like beta-propeller repeat n=1 Tax=Stigmatella erecta TaxID=83460 RepID=A0A1I0KZN6_9BACT|nr:PQQ-binding-like beta-propeller repeat protein [Stigmatella erecta]SEU31834.1 Outer membrane protein assembly factor BamB, contains PQQ-like beta-propeller repeat [Stigmatella erecta]
MRGFMGGLVVLGLVAGCSVPSFEELGLACVADEDCGPSGLCVAIDGQKLCRKKPDVVSPTQCSPACLPAEACTTDGCERRFSAVEIREPGNGVSVDGGTIPIVAELTEQYVTEAEWPTLVFTATREDGSPAGAIPVPTRIGNTYTVQWTVPDLDEQVTVTAAYAEANLRDTVLVDVDTVAPTFTIGFSNPPVRVPGRAGVQAEQKDPTAGYEDAFRRDEAVTVAVSSNDDTVTHAQLTVTGMGLGGILGRTEIPITVDLQRRASCPSGQSVCGERTVDLSVPEMSDFRGAMWFRASGEDRAGHHGVSADTPLWVTRWKWAFDAAVKIEGTPAIGNQGRIYFGTNSGTGNGNAYGVDVAGTRKWIINSGDVIGSPAVGALNGNEEYVYIASSHGQNTALYALRADGTEKAKCNRSLNGYKPGAIAVGNVGRGGGTDVVETAAVVGNNLGSRIALIRPDATGLECVDAGGVSSPSVAGAMVLKDGSVFYGVSGGGFSEGSPNPALNSCDILTEGDMPREGWPQIFPASVYVYGLAIVNDSVYASAGNVGDSSVGGLFKISVNGGNVESLFPTSGGSRVFNFSIGSGGTAYFGTETNPIGNLRSLQLGTGAPSAVMGWGVGILRGAPVVGRGGNLYTVNTEGEVRAWTPSSTTPLWGTKIEPGAGKGTNISPTLDCLRDASGQAVVGSRLGVLYVTADTKVYAFIVDSPGLDPDAPWPKYQHDARNTGNPATPIPRCP